MAQITIVVPIYLVEAYLPRCIDSILNQTFQDFELILVDDGSPDNCPAICEEYAVRDDRITVIHQDNGGLSVARNTGIEWTLLHGTSQWITFVDSDDWIHPRMLELLLNAAYECETEISICHFEKTSGEQPEKTIYKNPYKLSAEQVWISEPIPMTAWGKLYKINCFNDIRYPVGKCHEDEYVTYRILFNEPEIAVVPVPLYFYFQNPDGIMKSPWQPKRLDYFEAIEEQLNFFENNGYLKAYQYVCETRISTLASQCLEIERENNPNFTKHKKYLRHELRKQLRKTGKKLHIFEAPDKNIWVYEAAYPMEMRIWWIIKAIQKRFSST